MPMPRMRAGESSAASVFHTELGQIDPVVFLDPGTQVDEYLVLRHYACPGYGSLLDAAICRPEDPAWQDVVIYL